MRQPKSRPDFRHSAEIDASLLLHSSVAAAVVVRSDAQIVWANTWLGELLGVPDGGALVGRKLTEFLVDPADWQAWREATTDGRSLSMGVRTVNGVQTLRGDVRAAGEDLKAGVPVLRPGQPVRAADLGLLASLGIAEVRVKRRLRVAFFSTGDELASIGSPLAQGQVYDSNRYTIHALLTGLGCEVDDLGILPDRFEAVRKALDAAQGSHDLLVTSGIDGTYPPGLPVATVMRVERDASYTFARVLAQPVAGVERGRYALILSAGARPPPYPDDAERKGVKSRRARKPVADGS